MTSLEKSNLDKWANDLSYLNFQENQIYENRVKLYTNFAKKVKQVFMQYLRKDVHVRFMSNGALIKVECPVNVGESIRLTSSFIDALVLPVSVLYDNERCIVFELYPEVDFEDFSCDESENEPTGTIVESENEPTGTIVESENSEEKLVLNKEYESAPATETISSILQEHKEMEVKSS